MKSISRKFSVYSAVGIAGGMTFGTTASEADIIFTDFQGQASVGNPLDIDLDADGTIDFIFDLRVVGPNGYGSNSNWAAMSAQGANQFASIDPSPYGGQSYGPNNLAYGATISGQGFAGGAGPLQLAYTSFNASNIYGGFAALNSGYVGVQFASGGGSTVFGWIGVTVNGDVTNDNFTTATIDIDGFAYARDGETIFAGQTSSVIPEPSSIGLLALGAAGLATRRRKKSGEDS